MKQGHLFADSFWVKPSKNSPRVREIASLLPQTIRLGTSSWTFPGWKGLVYADQKGLTTKVLAHHGLSAYAAHPLLRTVSLDRTFYRPLSIREFASYASKVPDHFQFLIKAPSFLTRPLIQHVGSKRLLVANPSFLDSAMAKKVFLQPCLEGLQEKTGPIVFQFPPLGPPLLRNTPRLLARMAAFLSMLPRGPLYAVEVRDHQLVSRDFASCLEDAGAVPCLSVHTCMPPVDIQASAYGLTSRDHQQPIVVRWNLRSGRQYEEAKAKYTPFNTLVEEDVTSRLSLAKLAQHASENGKNVFITVNNKAEGSAPLSIVKLAEAIIASHADDGETRLHTT